MFSVKLLKKAFQATQSKTKSEEDTKGKAKNEIMGVVIPLAALMLMITVSRWLWPVPITATYVCLAINETPLYLEHAAHKRAWRQGLRQRPYLATNGGMFFDLGAEPQQVTVTMQGVNFPLRVATLSDELRVIEAVELMPGEENQHEFRQPVKWFVEVHPDVELTPGSFLQEVSPGFEVKYKKLLRRDFF